MTLSFHLRNLKKIFGIRFKDDISTNKEFKLWIRMIMSFPFLLLENIDEVSEELKESSALWSSR